MRLRTLARRIYPERFAALKAKRSGSGPRWYLTSPWLRRVVKAGEHRGGPHYVQRFLGRSWAPFGGRIYGGFMGWGR